MKEFNSLSFIFFINELIKIPTKSKILNSKAKTTPYTNRPGIGIIIVSVKAINA